MSGGICTHLPQMCLWSRSKRFGGFYDSGEIVLSMYHISREIMLGQYVHTVSYVVLLLVRHSERERDVQSRMLLDVRLESSLKHNKR